MNRTRGRGHEERMKQGTVIFPVLCEGAQGLTAEAP